MTHQRDDVTAGLAVYVVGGAVRDALLEKEAGDRDWVVVGSTPETLAQRGFIPVGGDFPVFLHPHTKEEYALARTERKTARGYQGFSFYTGPEVTLEDDLLRRDLTVNAIAQDASGVLTDPLNGVRDIRLKVLRHVGPAFQEDPVRILRLARFAARFDDFTVAPETLSLCKDMVASGEVDALVPERVWKEVSRGLMAQKPSRMFDVLRACGALGVIAPDLHDDAQLGTRVDRAARAGLALPQRYALLCLASPAVDRISSHWRVPTQCADYARLLPRFVEAAALDDIDSVLGLIERADALRKPDRFMDLILAAALMAPGVDAAGWRARVDAVVSIDAGAIARECGGAPSRIKPAISAARRAVLQRLSSKGAIRQPEK